MACHLANTTRRILVWAGKSVCISHLTLVLWKRRISTLETFVYLCWLLLLQAFKTSLSVFLLEKELLVPPCTVDSQRIVLKEDEGSHHLWTLHIETIKGIIFWGKKRVVIPTLPNLGNFKETAKWLFKRLRTFPKRSPYYYYYYFVLIPCTRLINFSVFHRLKSSAFFNQTDLPHLTQ